MKILWLSHNIPYPPKGGVLQRNYNLVKEIARYHEVYIVAFNQKSLLPSKKNIDEAVAALAKIVKHVEYVSIPADRSKFDKYFLLIKSLFTKTPYTVNWNRSREYNNLVKKVTNAFKPDLIHYDTIGLAEYYNTTFSGPQVLNHHNIESAMLIRRKNKEKNLFKRAYFLQEAIKLERYERSHCALFQLNITVSESDKELLKKVNSKLRIEVITNGVDTTFFSPLKGKQQTKSLIFAGGMSWYPNRDAMIYFAKKIWPLLKTEIPGVTMTVIGRHPPLEVIELSNYDSKYRVTGFVDDVRPYFNESQIYVCPIRDGGGTRLKVLDALAMGKPMVATAIAVEGLNLEENKHVLIAETPEQFVEQIAKLLKDGTLYGTLSCEGRRFVVENYDWLAIGQKLSSIYELCYQKKESVTR